MSSSRGLVAFIALRTRSRLCGPPTARHTRLPRVFTSRTPIPDRTWMASEAGLARFPSHDGGPPFKDDDGGPPSKDHDDGSPTLRKAGTVRDRCGQGGLPSPPSPATESLRPP